MEFSHPDVVANAFIQETLKSTSLFGFIHFAFPLLWSVFTGRFTWPFVGACTVEVLEVSLELLLYKNSPLRTEDAFNVILMDLGMAFFASLYGPIYGHLFPGIRRPLRRLKLNQAPRATADFLVSRCGRIQVVQVVLVACFALVYNNGILFARSGLFALLFPAELQELVTILIFIAGSILVVAFIVLWERYMPGQCVDLWSGQWKLMLVYWGIYLGYIICIALVVVLVPLGTYLVVWPIILLTGMGLLAAAAVKMARGRLHPRAEPIEMSDWTMGGASEKDDGSLLDRSTLPMN